MYFSRIKPAAGPEIFSYLNSDKAEDLYSEHQLLWSMFPGEPDSDRDFLFRKETTANGPFYYVVSRRTPAPKSPLFNIETKEFSPVIRAGDKFSFSLRANPVIAKKKEGEKNSKRHDVWMNALIEGKKRGYHSAELNAYASLQAKKWLISRSQDCGFTTDENSIAVESYTHHRFYGNKSRRVINFSSLDYRGVLEVTDEKAMLDTLYHGIGKARAFGCGLLLIKKI
ncbi:MAG TPA: type I-E CRISPR-associated protein Cas6/Cse3/CasE [Spirochaetota bacterium]|nr:type I-E CRISPR-associated protein Cas6/Cse3/CasE [Spirochaetota bacterium]HPI90727.1 type I-E CRISPR-associated protein Cas6/Cse3/CasE [Spirochaetota bacterium]HPR49748.1 type I-E CRISPR-associated protein Cas6/Cse3/CasE [Spirochaetota bacterium]